MDSHPEGFERRERVDDLMGNHNGTSLVWNVDLKSGAHLLAWLDKTMLTLRTGTSIIGISLAPASMVRQLW
jgi:hypothetical protein